MTTTINAIARQRAEELVGEAGKLLRGINRGASLSEVAPEVFARMFGMRTSNPQFAGHGFSDIAAALTQSDFASAFGIGIEHALSFAYARAAAHRSVCAEIEARDFRPTPTLLTDVDVDNTTLGAATVEGPEVPSVSVMSANGAELNALTRASRVFNFTPEVSKNDTFGLAALLVRELAVGYSRVEERAVFGAIHANPVLSDARAMFNTTDANDVGPAAISAATIETASALMARQKTPSGAELGLAPRFLLVSPEKRITAMSLVRGMTLEGAQAPLEVIASNTIPAASNAFYLFADPALASCIAFMTLRGRNGRTISVRTDENFRTSAPSVAIDHIFAVSILGRIGAVRGGV